MAFEWQFFLRVGVLYNLNKSRKNVIHFKKKKLQILIIKVAIAKLQWHSQRGVAFPSLCTFQPNDRLLSANYLELLTAFYCHGIQMISINFVFVWYKNNIFYFINLWEFSSISSSIIEYNQYCFTWAFPQVIPKIFIIWQFAPFAAGLINMFYVYTLHKHCRILSTPGSSR